MRLANCVALTFLMIGSIASAQDASAQDPVAVSQTADNPAADASQQPESTKQAPKLPSRWLLLCCGLPGDQEHRERLTSACEQIISAADSVLGVSPERLRLLVGDEEMHSALADQAKSVGVCTKESVLAAMERLCDEVQDDDACWVVLLGHAHLYDGTSHFNVLEEDFDQTEFALWAKPLACSEQVFWITMPVSGFWIKPLSGGSRVVISATEADLEFTGTEMPYALADLLTGQHEQQSLEDIDQDSSLSLLDLYLATNMEIQGRFASIERLQTEHAQLEDNGDGRGSEVQRAYLREEGDQSPDEADSTNETETSEEVIELPKPINNQSLDGYRSRHIMIRSPMK